MSCTSLVAHAQQAYSNTVSWAGKGTIAGLSGTVRAVYIICTVRSLPHLSIKFSHLPIHWKITSTQRSSRSAPQKTNEFGYHIQKYCTVLCRHLDIVQIAWEVCRRMEIRYLKQAKRMKEAPHFQQFLSYMDSIRRQVQKTGYTYWEKAGERMRVESIFSVFPIEWSRMSDIWGEEISIFCPSSKRSNYQCQSNLHGQDFHTILST